MTKGTSKNKNADSTAVGEYAALRNDLARLLDVLDMELAKHDGRAKASPANWGLAGDLAKVRSDLIDVVAFISGMEREAIEAFLDDAI